MKESGEFTPETAHRWRNLSSFAARCLRAEVLGPWVHLMDALRDALEEDPGIEQDLVRAECKIVVASDWIVHAAKRLVQWAQENIGYVDGTEDDTQRFERGALYTGPPFVGLRRWGFWQTRFEELGKHTGLGKEAQEAALRAAETMKAMESRVANTLR